MREKPGYGVLHMNCSRDLIEAYLDDELDPGRVASIEDHLSGCASCSEAYSRFRARKANIRSIAPYYPGAPITESGP
jgi:anti-sigma factor RsiW